MSNAGHVMSIPLWPGAPPGTEDWSHQEQETTGVPLFGIRVVRNIVRPDLIAYLPDPATASGTAVIVCPGGAFHILAIDHEGHDVARWLATRGMAAFILRYRLQPTAVDDEEFAREMQARMSDPVQVHQLIRRIAPLSIADGLQAIRVVRRHAAVWGIAPERVGIMGFSAGGVVTTGVATGYDTETRPAFAAPIYTAPWEHGAVPADAPPLFLALAADDAMAVGASLPLFSAWRAAGCQAELHIYAGGGHGFGMFRQGIPTDDWIERFGEWLRAQGW